MTAPVLPADLCADAWPNRTRTVHHGADHECQRPASHKGRCLCDCGSYSITMRKAER